MQTPWTVLRAADIEFSSCLNQACGVCLRSTSTWAFENVQCYPSLTKTGQSQGWTRRALADRGALVAVDRSRRSHVQSRSPAERCSALFCAPPKQARTLGTAYHGFSSALFCDHSLIPDPLSRSIMPRMSDSWSWLYALTGCGCPHSLVKVSCHVHDLSCPSGYLVWVSVHLIHWKDFQSTLPL